MKVLIGVDPHKGSVATAVVDIAMGELVERASFLQSRTGLRAFEDALSDTVPERRWTVENAGDLGRYLAGRLWQRQASVWLTFHPSFQHGLGCSLASLATPAGLLVSRPPQTSFGGAARHQDAG